MDGDIKIIYKNRLKENYLKQNKNSENINFVKEFFNQYLTYESKNEIESIFNANNFIKIYNFLYLIKDKQNLLDIYSYINQLLVKFINTKLITDEKNNQDIDHIIEIIKYINNIEKKIKNIKSILITCTSRFDSDLIKSMDEQLDISSIFLKSNNILTKFIENSEKIFLDQLVKEKQDKQYLYISIFQFLNIIKIISYNKKIERFSEKTFEIIIKESNYEKIYEEMLKCLNQKISEENIIQSNFINQYFNSINNQIEKDYVIFLKIFGEREANKYKEKIIKIYIFDKLINDIFKNEKLLRMIVSEKNYDILKIIESKTRQSLQLTKEFINTLFDIILIDFENKIIMPKEKTDINKGIEIVEKILLKIKELNSIFKEVFNQNRKVQLKFHETLLKLISSKKFESLEYFLSIYVNENLYKENIRNNYILDKAFIQLLANLDNKEYFFKYYQKLIIRRISNNIFNLEIEAQFYNFLKKNIENRYMIEINRIFKDIEDSKFINEYKSENYFYLFSFNKLDNEYDLIQIIDLEKEKNEILNPFKTYIDNYNQIYPKRKIKISQIFSTLEVIFLNKYNLVVNYIQWYILKVILEQKYDKYSITYEKLSSLISFKPQNKIYLKVYLNSLIEMKILIKKSNNIIENEFNSEDIIQINFNFETKKNNILCFIKPNNTIKNMIKNINKKESENKENEEINYMKNYKVNAIKENVGRIIDCVIIQILKALSREEKMKEKDLIINLLKHKIIDDLQLKKYNSIDTLYIKERIENLNKREIIKKHFDIDDDIISYSYY